MSKDGRAAPDANPMRSSVRTDGKRNFVHPADVRGRFASARKWVFAILIAIYVALPWIQIGGHPALFFDIEHRQFYVFGLSLNAQDLWLSFFVVSGLGFALFVITTLWGRIWCGYACPQTVFLEGVFRRVERWIEGPRLVRLRRNKRAADLDKIWRKTLKHALFLILAAAVAHIFMSYFVSLPRLWKMMGESPAEHPVAFGWVFALTAVMYFNFAWFREQLCLVICPYGRLQSVMTDSNTLIIGYDTKRGEPRGKKSDPKAADCVDCGRCVAVCPTGIDIRNGLQMDCIGCAACVDACDEIMTKLKRDTGLVRYDSLNGFAGAPKRFWRPRLWLYVGLGIAGLIASGLALFSRVAFEANLLRATGEPFIVDGERVRNSFRLHVVNKTDQDVTYTVKGEAQADIEFVLPRTEITVEGHGSSNVPVLIAAPIAANKRGTTIELTIEPDNGGSSRTARARFLAPRVGPGLRKP